MIAERVDYSVPTDLQQDLSGLRTKALIVGVIGVAATAAGYAVYGAQEFFRSYLWAYIYLLALTMGPFAWMLIQYATGGAWGVITRRPAEAAARTIWLALLLFIGIVAGAKIGGLYQWMDPAYVNANE